MEAPGCGAGEESGGRKYFVGGWGVDNLCLQGLPSPQQTGALLLGRQGRKSVAATATVTGKENVSPDVHMIFSLPGRVAKGSRMLEGF